MNGRVEVERWRDVGEWPCRSVEMEKGGEET